jgi:hypothetical protein
MEQGLDNPGSGAINGASTSFGFAQQGARFIAPAFLAEDNAYP